MDFSDKGEKDFYQKWFKDMRYVLENASEKSPHFKELISSKLDCLKSYRHQKEMYHEQLGMLWDNKKNYLLACMREKEKYNGAISLELQEKGKTIDKCEERLKGMSKSFKEDLEKIIQEDKDLQSFTINPN